MREAIDSTIKPANRETFLSSPRELLDQEHGVWVELPKPEHARAVASLFQQAYDRNDYFAGRYDDPEGTIFNPDWVQRDFANNPQHNWFIFTNTSNSVIGITGFFHDYDIDGRPVMTSDETQIAPEGRGQHIMNKFFRLVVPRIEATGDQLATSFVLTPQTKGLRRVLEAEEGMVSLGILPHVLKHRKSGITRSEIASAKFGVIHPRVVALIADFVPLYRIVKSQIPALPEPTILPPSLNAPAPFAEIYQEAPQRANGSDPQQQWSLLQAGYKPVAYYPRLNSFIMAKFPTPAPQLDFLIENESIEPNKHLVRYLKEVLYKNA